jgi:hypothetical protein
LGACLSDQDKIENAEDFTNINAEIEGLLTEYEISPFTLSFTFCGV